MSAVAIGLVLLSAVFHALRSLFTKASGVMGIAGYTLILTAFTIERVSYIFALRQISIVFAVPMGSRILKEKHGATRLTGAVIIFMEGFLISLAK